MNKNGEVNVGTIVMLLVVIIVSLTLISSIFTEQTVMTTKRAIVDESTIISSVMINAGAVNVTPNFTVTNAPSGWKVTECPLESIVVTNSSGTVLTSATDYIVHSEVGIISYLNTSAVYGLTVTDNTTLVDYSYCPDGYNTDSGARGIAGTIGLFTIISLMVFVAGAALKEWFANR